MSIRRCISNTLSRGTLGRGEYSPRRFAVDVFLVLAPAPAPVVPMTDDCSLPSGVRWGGLPVAWAAARENFSSLLECGEVGPSALGLGVLGDPT